MHLVTRFHFRSRNKCGGYTIQSTLPENPMLHANITALCLIEQELLPIEVFFDSCDLDLDLDPITFIYELPVVRKDMPHVHI